MKNVVSILKWDYQKARSNFYYFSEFDNLNGLLYLHSTSEEYKFKIIDEQKWFLAKIKYGF